MSAAPSRPSSPLAAVVRAEHRLAQVSIRRSPLRQPAMLGRLGTGEGLFRAVVDARDPEREQLHGDRAGDVQVGSGTRREAQLGPEDVIVVVEDRDVPVADVAVRTDDRPAGVEPVEVGARRPPSLGHGGQGRSHLADVERSVEVAIEHVQVAVLGEVTAGDLAGEEEVLLADVGGELLDRPAERPRLVERHVLEGVDPEPVAIGQGDPVLEAAGDVGQHLGFEVDVSQGEEVAALVLCARVVEIAATEVARPRAGVDVGVLELGRPHPVGRAADVADRSAARSRHEPKGYRPSV